MKLCMGCMNTIEDHARVCPYCGFDEKSLRQESYYLSPGTVIGGKYIVGRVLKYGGHTISYLGMDAEHNRKVIVKEYLPSDFSTRSEGEKEVTIYSGDGQEQFVRGLTNFLNESNCIQHLQNVKGIATVYDCMAENDTGYVISEYVEGRTLKEILEEGKIYSPQEASSFICKILQGLSSIHHMDIVHCDISPEAIMVTDAGDVKLMDFGATRYVTTANSKSLSIILKRGYAPEEQYRSKGRRGPWTDVYALGAVMYQMITGEIPQESVERAMMDDLKEPSKMGIAIPQNMENALMNALNVYQEERTPSAEVFRNELTGENVKRIKVKRQKNKTGKFPLWAKGLVAGLACVVAAGGIYVTGKMLGRSTDTLDSKVIVMQDLRGKSEEEAGKYIIDTLNKEHPGWDIQLEISDSVFDIDAKKNNTVYSQSIPSGTAIYDPDKEIQEEVEGLEYDEEGNVTGIISCTLYSNEELHYDEISGLNAFELAKKLNIDTDNKEYFAEKEGGENYFDLDSIEVAGQTITAEELNSIENKDKIIKYSKDIKINYFASEFFYWKELPDFKAYGRIDDVPKQLSYKYKNENERKKVKKKYLEDSNLIDQSYFAVESSGYSQGQILGQNIAPGKEYDGSKPGEELLQIQVIGTILEYHGKTGYQFSEELKNYNFGGYGFETSSGKQGDGNQKILNVIVCKENAGGEQLSYFQSDPNNDRSLFFRIIVEEKKIKSPGSSTNTGGSSSGSSTKKNSSTTEPPSPTTSEPEQPPTSEQSPTQEKDDHNLN